MDFAVAVQIAGRSMFWRSTDCRCNTPDHYTARLLNKRDGVLGLDSTVSSSTYGPCSGAQVVEPHNINVEGMGFQDLGSGCWYLKT